MTLSRLALAILCLAVSAGCGTRENLKPGTTLESLSNDAVVVMGVRPRVRVEFNKGDVQGENVSVSALALTAWPESGYIVGKVPVRTGNEVIFLSAVLPEGYGLRPQYYLPCRGTKALTFETPPGKVVYVGDVSFNIRGQESEVAYTHDFEAAKEFIGKTYPDLMPALVSQPPTPRYMMDDLCRNLRERATIVIPVFVPGGR